MPLQPLISAALTQTNAGTSIPYIIGPAWLSGGPNPTIPIYDKTIGVTCFIASGSPTYTVQVTANRDPTTTQNWVNHGILQNQTTSSYGDISSPITGVRLVVTGTGVVNLDVCRWC